MLNTNRCHTQVGELNKAPLFKAYYRRSNTECRTIESISRLCHLGFLLRRIFHWGTIGNVVLVYLSICICTLRKATSLVVLAVRSLLRVTPEQSIEIPTLSILEAFRCYRFVSSFRSTAPVECILSSTAHFHGILRPVWYILTRSPYLLSSIQ